MKPAPINSSDSEAWREGQHDDLVFAVALAAWWASNHTPKPQSERDRWKKLLDEHEDRFARSVV